MEASELKAILEQHRLWLAGKGGSRANLNGAFLGSANLRDANLRDADIRGADIRHANLTGANLRDANLYRADLQGAILNGANLERANLEGAYLHRANLTGAILPDISWIIPGCLVQLNNIRYLGFWLEKEIKRENFVQDSFGFFIQDNGEQKTFDILVGDRIIRGIPNWVKLSGMKQILS